MKSNVIPVILSGGAGTRLWPLSRRDYPKQFLKLLSEYSCIQNTAKRMRAVCDDIYVVAAERYRFAVAEQLQEVSCTPERILLEPDGRNTAPAIALAALSIAQDREDQIMVVVPSDHLISDEAAFYEALERAAKLSDSGRLITLSVTPESPTTQYGYIKQGAPIINHTDAYQLDEFIEKPDIERAKQLLQDKKYSWNSGIFVGKVATFLAEMKRLCPTVVDAAYDALRTARKETDFTFIGAKAYRESPAISFDYAVMERTDKAAVIPVKMGWSDLGSYEQLWQNTPKDEANNAVVGEAALLRARGNYVHSEDHITALIGVENLLVVATRDAVLVANRSEDQNIGALAKELIKHGKSEAIEHRRVYRPWGYYEALYIQEGVQVKALSIKPASRMSLQKHEKRSEHWVVIEGEARITVGQEQKIIEANESIFVPVGSAHRIENVSEDDWLKIIEVQSGEYIGEDDIVRIEDDYGRKKPNKETRKDEPS
ncbi:MAG: mannose-1-phosphate guanylyltransferase/mannose-6-phosphate isomerase [Rickettsiales bacterium]|nr:mannose-1-phosphate guanylyltransferase/mannose-6-phosphate isomerase [Rickettsiales bacterium]